MGTSLIVSIGAVSCYPVLMNLIWFANKKCLSRQHYETWGQEIKRLAIQKYNHFESLVC